MLFRFTFTMSTKQILIDNADRSGRSFPGISSSINPNSSSFILTLPPAQSLPINVSQAAQTIAGPLAISNDVEAQIALYWQNLTSDLQNSTHVSRTGSPYVSFLFFNILPIYLYLIYKFLPFVIGCRHRLAIGPNKEDHEARRRCS